MLLAMHDVVTQSSYRMPRPTKRHHIRDFYDASVALNSPVLMQRLAISDLCQIPLALPAIVSTSTSSRPHAKPLA